MLAGLSLCDLWKMVSRYGKVLQEIRKWNLYNVKNGFYFIWVGMGMYHRE